MLKLKSINQFKPKLDVKPSALSTMLMSFTSHKGVETVIVDLADIEIEDLKYCALITIMLPKKVFGKSHTGCDFVLSISDDPTMNHALDWTQLGHSRIRITGKKIKQTKNQIMQFKTQDFNLELLQPERRFPHDPETKFYFW